MVVEGTQPNEALRLRVIQKRIVKANCVRVSLSSSIWEESEVEANALVVRPVGNGPDICCKFVGACQQF